MQAVETTGQIFEDDICIECGLACYPQERRKTFAGGVHLHIEICAPEWFRRPKEERKKIKEDYLAKRRVEQ